MVARNRVGVGGGIGGTDGGICRPMVVLRRPWTTVVILALLAASFVSPLLLFLRVPAVFALLYIDIWLSLAISVSFGVIRLVVYRFGGFRKLVAE
ncbi:hypothetical protein BHE74_00044233 [Ensete ventricosum]|nr:hypothetical protein BHE74_00044233 [Ensete ventricosum]